MIGITAICAPVLDGGEHAVASSIISYVNRHGREPRHAEALAALQETCRAIGRAGR